MLRFFMMILSLWMCVKVFKCFIKLSYGTIKFLITIVFVICMPALLGFLLLASGAVLLMPVIILAFILFTLNVCT